MYFTKTIFLFIINYEMVFIENLIKCKRIECKLLNDKF